MLINGYGFLYDEIRASNLITIDLDGRPIDNPNDGEGGTGYGVNQAGYVIHGAVSGGAAVINRASSQKVAELRSMLEAQKKYVLSLRSDKDQASILVRDVETARRAYDAISQRATQVNLEAQNNKSPLRVLSVAVEPFEPSLKNVAKGVVLSLAAGFMLAFGVAFLLEFVNRRVRGTEDLSILHGVPVIGVLRPAGSKRPIFRRLAAANSPASNAPLLSGGARP